jgi:predicted acetyltransferase
MSFMARGVDWSAALQARAFPRGVQGRLSVRLDDAVFGLQTFELELDAGHARVRAAGSDDDADVRCEVATFSQLCCGALSASQARWYGFLHASDATLALLEQAFPFGPPFIHQFDWF